MTLIQSAWSYAPFGPHHGQWPLCRQYGQFIGTSYLMDKAVG